MTIRRRYKLTKRQASFVSHYASSGIVSEASLKAGYAGAQEGHRLLKQEKIRLALQEARPSVRRKTVAIADRGERQEWLTRIIRGHESGMEEPAVRIKACDMLCRMQGDYVIKVEADVTTIDKTAARERLTRLLHGTAKRAGAITVDLEPIGE